MNFSIIIYGTGLYKEIPLIDEKKLIIGTSRSAQVRFLKKKGDEDFELCLEQIPSGWKVSCSSSVQIKSEETCKKEDMLQLGSEIQIVDTNSEKILFSIYFSIYFEKKANDFHKRIDCRQINSFRIGGRKTSTIQILDADIEGRELLFTYTGKGYMVSVKECPGEVRINGAPVKIPEIMMENRDFLSFAGYDFYYCDGWIYVSDNMPVSTSMLVELVQISKNHMIYPKLNRSVRQLYVIPSERIEVLQPQNIGTKPEKTLIMTILPILLSMFMMVSMRFMMGGNLRFALCSIGMMGSGIIMAVWNYKNQGKSYDKRAAARIEKYNLYIQESENQIRELRKKEERIARQQNPTLEEQLQIVEDFDSRLFEKRPEDADFLCCYIGSGKLKSENQVEYKKQEYKELEDVLMEYPAMLHDKYQYSENRPIMIPFKECNAVGFIGDRNRLYQIIKNIMLSLAIQHYYRDVRFCLLIDPMDIPYFSWCRWLQNMDNEKTNRRNISCDEQSRSLLLEFLYTELSLRESHGNGNAVGRPHYVVFLYRCGAINEHPISNYFSRARELGFTFLFFEEYPELLHKDCDKRVFLNKSNNEGYIQDVRDGENIQRFRYPHIEKERAYETAKKLSCVYVEEVSLEGSLTRNITLYELLHISTAEQLPLKQRWNSSKIYESMAAPLGVKTGNEIVYLDLHEKFHGPHGLVAGTTGSGKSEILQSYVLSMATLFHPYEVGFIIIDFKGGGMANQFRNLPHLNGAITNIDGKQINRSLMSIRAELLKRQRLFAEYDVNHIDDYIRLYKNGKTPVPLPHLILIVDEFAELKSEQPEFMKELISAARIGRSLGVHLILATQKPAGVVNDQIWSNSNFKLCLRVQTKNDSNEVLKSPLAAEIREPGRAYLQVGNNEIFLLFQSAYSGAAIPCEDMGEVRSFTINQVDICGRRTPVFQQKPEKKEINRNQLDALVDYISKYCEKENIAKLPDICLPPLGTVIPYENEEFSVESKDICVPLGYYDDPSRQVQERTEINLTKNNIVILGASGSGKTNLIQGMVRHIAEHYEPEEVCLYILDYASMVLKRFESLVFVGGVTTLQDENRLKSFMKMIMEELTRRKEILSDKGYSSFSVYRECGEKELSQIIIFIDNVGAFRSEYEKYEEALMTLCREGLAVGITVVVTATQANGIGYRYMANFSKRIALYCNESSEYSHLFDRCRIQPDNNPGRFLVELNKEIFEGQSFLAFSAEKESEKIVQIDRFIEDINQKFKGRGVKKVPVLPKVLTQEVLEQIPADMSKPYTIRTGLDYVTLEPRTINLMRNNSIGILAKEHAGGTNFLNYMIAKLLSEAEKAPVQIRILDNVDKKLAHWSRFDKNVKYSFNPVMAEEFINEIDGVLSERYDRKMNGEAVEETYELYVLIINATELYTSLSSQNKLCEKFAKIFGIYKGFGAASILAKLPNSSMSFSIPPFLRCARGNMNLFVFYQLAEQKAFEFPQSILRENAKALEVGDAYEMEGTQLAKLKTPLYEGLH